MTERRVLENRDWRFAMDVRKPGDRIIVVTAGFAPDLVYEVGAGRKVVGPTGTTDPRVHPRDLAGRYGRI